MDIKEIVIKQAEEIINLNDQLEYFSGVERAEREASSALFDSNHHIDEQDKLINQLEYIVNYMADMLETKGITQPDDFMLVHDLDDGWMLLI